MGAHALVPVAVIDSLVTCMNTHINECLPVNVGLLCKLGAPEYTLHHHHGYLHCFQDGLHGRRVEGPRRCFCVCKRMQRRQQPAPGVRVCNGGSTQTRQRQLLRQLECFLVITWHERHDSMSGTAIHDEQHRGVRVCVRGYEEGVGNDIMDISGSQLELEGGAVTMCRRA